MMQLVYRVSPYLVEELRARRAQLFLNFDVVERRALGQQSSLVSISYGTDFWSGRPEITIQLPEESALESAIGLVLQNMEMPPDRVIASPQGYNVFQRYTGLGLKREFCAEGRKVIGK